MGSLRGITEYVIQNPGLYMVAGVTGVGKTKFVTNMIKDFNARDDKKHSVYCYSSENDCQLLGETDQIKNIDLSILPCSTEHILLESLWEYKDIGLSVVVVDDYRFLLRGEIHLYNKLSKKERLLCILTRLKVMSDIFSVPVILTSSVDDDYIYGRKNNFPRISDIYDGKYIKPLIDRFIFLHREEMYSQDTDKKGLLECRLYEPVSNRIEDYLFVSHPEIERYIEVTNEKKVSYE